MNLRRWSLSSNPDVPPRPKPGSVENSRALLQANDSLHRAASSIGESLGKDLLNPIHVQRMVQTFASAEQALDTSAQAVEGIEHMIVGATNLQTQRLDQYAAMAAPSSTMVTSILDSLYDA